MTVMTYRIRKAEATYWLDLDTPITINGHNFKHLTVTCGLDGWYSARLVTRDREHYHAWGCRTMRHGQLPDVPMPEQVAAAVDCCVARLTDSATTQGVLPFGEAS